MTLWIILCIILAISIPILYIWTLKNDLTGERNSKYDLKYKLEAEISNRKINYESTLRKLNRYIYFKEKNEYIKFLLTNPSVRDLERQLQHTTAHSYHLALMKVTKLQLKNEYVIIGVTDAVY